MNMINIAVFYNKNRWNRLIHDCLLPLLDKISLSFDVKKYLIAPSFERGNHIRLVLWAGKNSGFVTSYTIHYIKSWLKKNRSTRSTLENKELYLWMNFDNNSIHLDSFSQHKFSYPILSNISVCQMLSRQVAYRIIEEQDIELSDLLRCALLLGIRIINFVPNFKLLKSINNVIDFIGKDKEIDEAEINLIKQDFQENKDYLLEYYFSIDSWTDILEKDWIDFLVNNDFLLKDNKKQEIILVELFRSINICFGLSGSHEVYELVFVSELLNLVAKQ